MTSTNYNVGLSDGRNSSRVLKPPGGGHSQIFGGSGGDDDKPRQKRHNNSSGINGCFIESPAEKKEELIQELIKEPIIEDKQENVENSVPDSPVEEIKAAQTPQRVRVPPGGYSSGFW